MRTRTAILALALLFAITQLHAQNRTIKSHSADINIEDEISFTPLKETYSYYEDENGNYVKHGNYSRVGQKSINDSQSFKSGSHKVSYSLKTTYKDGLLNGTLTASRSSLTTVKNHISGETTQFNIKENATLGYANGTPHGQWKYTRTNNVKTTHSITINFDNGVAVGNYSSLNDGKQESGQLNSDGTLQGVCKRIYLSNFEGTFNKGGPDHDNQPRW